MKTLRILSSCVWITCCWQRACPDRRKGAGQRWLLRQQQQWEWELITPSSTRTTEPNSARSDGSTTRSWRSTSRSVQLWTTVDQSGTDIRQYPLKSITSWYCCYEEQLVTGKLALHIWTWKNTRWLISYTMSSVICIYNYRLECLFLAFIIIIFSIMMMIFDMYFFNIVVLVLHLKLILHVVTFFI